MRARISPISYFGQREAIITDLWLLLGDRKFKQLHDLCGGCGSISFAAMRDDKAQTYVYNDTFSIFQQLWNEIKEHPEVIISEYTALLNAFRDEKQHRESFYLDLLASFNTPKPENTHTQRERALQFAFLINFSKDNLPLFNNEKMLVVTPRTDVTDVEIDEHCQDFTKRSKGLATLLDTHNFIAKSGDFQSHLIQATAEDIVILDPPYPQQTREIYFNINTEDELFANLLASLKQLAERQVAVIILYGANAVLLKNQFPEADLDLKHLIRLAHHPLFGDYLEHVYISQSLFQALKTLPPHIMPYEKLFNPAKEMTTEACDLAMQDLKTAVATTEASRAQARIKLFQTPQPATNDEHDLGLAPDHNSTNISITTLNCRH